MEQVDLCDGADQVAVANLFCTVKMSEFWTPRFNNSQGDIVFAKVIAINERGGSLVSASNTLGADV